MEHLTKQQIVLLTLLVSFITSLSTGIVTVSLMDQTPEATHTINQIIEKTILPAQTASVGVVSINVDDQLSSSTASVSSAIVKIKLAGTDNVLGLGVVMSKDGYVVTSKSIIQQNQSYVVVTPLGAIFPVALDTTNTSIYSASDQLVILKPSDINSAALANFSPINISHKYNLGQRVFALTGTSTMSLVEGTITNIDDSKNELAVSMSGEDIIPGSPLFDIYGGLVGIKSSSVGDHIFYQIAK